MHITRSKDQSNTVLSSEEQYCTFLYKENVLERTYCYECVCIESPQEIQTLRKRAIKPPELLLARQKQMCHFSKYLRTTKKCHLPSALVSESKIKTWK